MKKAIHKHIGHGLRKSRVHLTKYLYERDTILATLWVFLFIVGLGAIPLNLGVLNPVKLGLKDFDFNDMSYSKLGKSKKAKYDDRIVIVNIGNEDRATIAQMIERVAAMNPKVMGLDAYFQGARDSLQDLIMSETFKKHKNLIVGDMLVLSGKEGDTVKSISYFKDDVQHGWVNLFQDNLATIRTFMPVLKDHHDSMLLSFPTAIVKGYDTSAYKILEKKGQKKVYINYTRNIDPDKSIQYMLMQPETVLSEEGFEPTLIKDKIVLFGYVNLDPTDITDKKFSPMNERFAGKSIPDMNGIVVHANIISMALDRDYIKKVPLWLTVLIAIVVCWLHMSFFIRYYLESHIWFHLVAKIAQVASAIFFVWLGIYLYDQFRLKLDLKLSIIVIVLAVDVIYFYEAFAVWMHKKYGFKTIFGHHGH